MWRRRGRTLEFCFQEFPVTSEPIVQRNAAVKVSEVAVDLVAQALVEIFVREVFHLDGRKLIQDVVDDLEVVRVEAVVDVHVAVVGGVNQACLMRKLEI